MKVYPIVNIMEYENLSGFLKAFYSAKKLNESSFSYEKWNRYLGSKNRSYLQLLVSGKRKVNDEYRDLFLNYFDFSNDQYAHFMDLVDISLARTRTTKSKLEKAIRRRKIQQETRVIAAHEAFLSNVKKQALWVLTSFNDVEATVENLAERLGESKATVKEWLYDLETLQYVYLDNETGTWHTRIDTYAVTSPSSKKEVINSYYQHCLEQALKSVKKNAGKTCSTSFALCLTEKQQQEFHERVQEFAFGLASEYFADSLGDRQIRMWTWTLYPVLD